MRKPRLAILLLTLFGIVSSPAGLRQAEAQETGFPGVEADCPVCRLWIEHEDALTAAHPEAAPVEDGVLYFFSGRDFWEVEDLRRFAYARRALVRGEEDRGHPRLGLLAGHRETPGEVRLEIAVSAHGFFALLRSDNPVTVDVLRREASEAVRRRTAVPF